MPEVQGNGEAAGEHGEVRTFTNRTKIVNQLIHRDTDALKGVLMCPHHPCPSRVGKGGAKSCEECMDEWLDTEVEWTPENGMDTDGH